MSLSNRVTLIGHTGKEVLVTTTQHGKRATVSLATNDFYKNAAGERVEDTQWHNIVAYGKIAEVMEKFLTKGKEVAIEGRITYRQYDKDGQRHYYTEIRAEGIQLLGGK